MATTQYSNGQDQTVHNFEPQQAADVAANLVGQDAFLSALVSRDLEQNLLGGGKKGRSVDVKVPSALIAHDRSIDDKTTGIILDELSEATESITLGTHAYSAVGLSEQDLHYEIEDFSKQVLRPQGEAVADYIENMVEDAFRGIAEDESIAWDETNPVPTFTAIRKALRRRGVPQTGLNVVVGVDVYAALLDAKAIDDASQSGSTAALRDGNIGRIRGFNIVESTRVGDGEIVAFHKNAFTLAVRAPLVPAGASFGSTSSAGGFPLRWLRDYDVRHTADLSLLSTFAGIAKMPLYRIERTYDSVAPGTDGTLGTEDDVVTYGSAQVVKDTAGAVMKVDTATAAV